jgi:hypothetical protein
MTGADSVIGDEQQDSKVASLRQEHASSQPRGEYPMHSVNDSSLAPGGREPLGDVKTKVLVQALAMAFVSGGVPSALDEIVFKRNGSIDDIRREIVRRERLGCGVGR